MSQETKNTKPSKANNKKKNKLTTEERKELRRLEGIVKRGSTTFLKVGHALAEIREQKLYREQYSSFKQYCEESLSISRQYGYMLATAASTEQRVAPLLEKHGLKPIQTERQLRELARIKEDKLDEAIEVLATEMKSEGKETIPFSRIKDLNKKEPSAENKESSQADVDSVPEVHEHGLKPEDGIKHPQESSETEEVSPTGNLVNDLKVALKLAEDGDDNKAQQFLKELVSSFTEQAAA